MQIHLLNTMTGKKEPFQPLVAGRVRMYCCGVTPYSNTHIGHSRTFFSYDLLFRALKDQGLDVDWARNITDVDDKIIAKANHEGLSCAEIVTRYITEQNEFLGKFELIRPKHEPKVTESIDAILDFIGALIAKEFAYASASGVYFRVRKFSDYGKLSKNKIDELRRGVRIEVDETKEDPLDFALWKIAKPGEISWASPWGEGRPGWHIECSAMARELFGDTLDIHMGGRDLIFPHHEAEIAQSEALSGKPFANFWLHAGMVTLYGEKMSKSTNHYVSIADFLGKYPTEVLRLTFLSVSYSQPLDFSYEMADENLKKLAKIYRFVALLDGYVAESRENEADSSTKEHSKVIFLALSDLVPRLRRALADDLNSGAALAVFFDFIRETNTGLAALEKSGERLCAQDRALLSGDWKTAVRWMRETLGILTRSPAEFFEELQNYRLGSEISSQAIAEKLAARQKAREDKDYAVSDAIRKELQDHGVLIQDTPNGTKWTVQI